jgi:ADP-ribose pyrophosphatase YjhB (NUDIX family)
MINLNETEVNTAGAYVSVNGLYPFVIGGRAHNGKIPIIRLGGHLEAEETGWQCAAREVYEEANLKVTPLMPETTYWIDGDHLEMELLEVRWQHRVHHEVTPILAVSYCREDQTVLSLMYLAQADKLPTPSAEVTGMLLLDQTAVHRLCEESLTLGQYLSSGGRTILREAFDESLILEPFIKLRLLSRILKRSG